VVFGGWGVIYWRWGGFLAMDEGRGEGVLYKFRWLIDSGLRIVKELVVEDLRELRHGKCRFHSVMLER